jgi:hypothetical protein
MIMKKKNTTENLSTIITTKTTITTTQSTITMTKTTITTSKTTITISTTEDVTTGINLSKRKEDFIQSYF